jgi:hypothetical protein
MRLQGVCFRSNHTPLLLNAWSGETGCQMGRHSAINPALTVASRPVDNHIRPVEAAASGQFRLLRQVWPSSSFWSSPCTLGAPQVGFSSAKRRISTRTSAVVFGRSPCARDRHFQKSRNPARCQRTTVSGFTMTSTSARQGQTRRKAAQNNRSMAFQPRSGTFPMEHGKLLPEGEDFQSVVSPTAEEQAYCRRTAQDECQEPHPAT